MNFILALFVAVSIFMTGCAGTVRLDKVEAVTVCAGGKCSPADHSTDAAALRGAIYRLLKSGEGGRYAACAASPDSRKCSSKGLSHYVQGGPIPGVGTLRGMEIAEVGYDPSTEKIVAVVDPDLYFIGTPLITTKHKTVVTVAAPNHITVVDEDSYTNWMAVGNQVFSFNFAVDYIDIDRGVLGGWYGWGVTGIGTGGGSGYALLTFPKTGDSSWFAAIPGNAPQLAAPVGPGQEDPVARKAQLAVASGSGVTSAEAADYADNLAREQERVALAEKILSREAEQAELKRRQLAERNEVLKRQQEEETIARERQQLEQERQRLEEVRLAAETRRKELEALRAELEKQRIEALRLQEERKSAEIERQRLETAKADELERLRILKLNVSFGRYHALVVGINAYQGFPKLKTAVNDAKVVAKLLQDEYNFQATLLTDATRAQILRALNDFRKTLNSNDNLLIYYAGHGWLDKDADEGYWLPVDATPDDPVNWIANSSITAAITAMTAKHVMVIADSCYSGKLMRGVRVQEKAAGGLEKLALKRTRVVMSSGGLEPVADAGVGEHSIFASALITALRENKGVMDGTRLFEQVRQPVMSNSDQTPEYADIHKAGHDGGDFIFVRQ
ncbi:MAG: caspase family protein [Thermodesulfobacteriota bacterium]